MSQRTVYDSGPIAGRGNGKKHVDALAAALRKQYPSRAFAVHVVTGKIAVAGKRPQAVYRLVVERKPG